MLVSSVKDAEFGIGCPRGGVRFDGGVPLNERRVRRFGIWKVSILGSAFVHILYICFFFRKLKIKLHPKTNDIPYFREAMWKGGHTADRSSSGGVDKPWPGMNESSTAMVKVRDEN